MSRRSIAAVAGTALVTALTCVPARADTAHRERLDTARPEAWAMRYFAAAFVDSGVGAPAELRPGSLELGLELGTLSHLSVRQRTVGFDGTKEEDLNRAPALARPVVRVGLPGRLVAALSWVPPLELDGATANVLTAALSRSFPTSARSRLELRLAATHGSVRGDFTCPASAAAAGSDPVRNPYACDEPSDDEQRFTTVGLGAAFALELEVGTHRPELRFALGAQHFDGTFHVDATYAGFHDEAHLENASWLGTVSVGLALPVTPRSRAALELFYAPLEVDRRPGPGQAAEREQDAFWNVRLAFAFAWR